MAGGECVHVCFCMSLDMCACFSFWAFCLGWHPDTRAIMWVCLFVLCCVFVVFVLCLCCVLVFVLCACVCAHSGEHCTCFDILAPAQCLTLALSASSNHSFCTPCHVLEVMTVIIFPDCFNSDSDNIDDVYEPQCHFRRLIPQNMPS